MHLFSKTPFRPVVLPGPMLMVAAVSTLLACDEPRDANGPPTEPVTLDPSDFTYRWTGSPPSLPLWTTPATRRVEVQHRPPEAERSGFNLSAARREFEPLQLLLGPATGEVSVAVEPFPNLGQDQRLELTRGQFASGRVDQLRTLGAGESFSLDGEAPVVLWLTLWVPPTAPAGEHHTTLTVSPAGGEPMELPINLYVFDFAIPEEIHYATQINVNVGGLAGDGSAHDAKELLFDLRMTPKAPIWPSGFGWNITWENPQAAEPCQSFWDEPTEAPEYSVGALARRYILGEGWNDVGFPNAMLFQFVDNSTPRPDSFCGESRGGHRGTAAYNAEWSAFLAGVEGYLRQEGMLDKAYYYVQNEPQNAEDEALAAHLCRLTRAAAPDLRIAVSEEPKPSIAEAEEGGCGYDIWIAHVRAYQRQYAWERQRDFNEEVWLYSLPQDPPPYFNPVPDEAEGTDVRIIPWVSWAERARGWAYYDGNMFFQGRQPTVRGYLLREGFEDYEYLYLANGGAHPEVFQEEPVDATVASVASSLTTWSRNPDALMTLRHELGRYLEGSRDSLPLLETTSDRPRATYFINFQDPQGAPTADPLVIEGQEYLKVGWTPYSAELGYGWYGEYIDNPGIALYGYDDGPYNEAQKSYVYDDYGRDNLFEFALANGRYSVTVGVGRPGRAYGGDPHHAFIEGIPIVNDEPTTEAEPQLRRTQEIDIADGSLSLVVGGLSATTGEYSYTFLAYLEIEPVD
jgi:hypothetical protein